jgi:hypothetical protein
MLGIDVSLDGREFGIAEREGHAAEIVRQLRRPYFPSDFTMTARLSRLVR